MDSQSVSSRSPPAPTRGGGGGGGGGRTRLTSSAAVAAAAHAAAMGEDLATATPNATANATTTTAAANGVSPVRSNPRAGNAPPPRSAARVGGSSRQAGGGGGGASSLPAFMSPGVRSPMFRTPPSSPPPQFSPSAVFRSPVGGSQGIRPHGSPGAIPSAAPPHTSPGVVKHKSQAAAPATEVSSSSGILLAHSPKRKRDQVATPPSSSGKGKGGRGATAAASPHEDAEDVTPSKKGRLSRNASVAPSPAAPGSQLRKDKSPSAVVAAAFSAVELRVLADQAVKRRVWGAYFGPSSSASGRQLCPGCGKPISLANLDFEVQTVLHLDQPADATDDMNIWNTLPLCSRQPADGGEDHDQQPHQGGDDAMDGWGCSETLERRRLEAEMASDDAKEEEGGAAASSDYATELATSGHVFDWMVTAHPERLHELIVRLQKAHGEAFGYPAGEALSIRFARDVYQIGKARSENDVIASKSSCTVLCICTTIL